MWISWHYLDPIMEDLDKLPNGTRMLYKPDVQHPYADYSTKGSIYSNTTLNPYNIHIRTIKQFNKALLLVNLGMSHYEIQQHMNLGITDDT